MQLIDYIRTMVRRAVAVFAVALNRISNGKLSPNTVTIIGCAAHIPIAVLIGLGDYNILAAILIVLFGLFDTLDGELARLQGRASAAGMLLDASTDRFKEALLYTGIAYALAMGSHPGYAALAAAACGASVSVSYVKAKGEAAVASTKNIPHAVLNKLFKDGLLTFELRMVLLIVGLLSGLLAPAVAIIAVLASYTALQRLVRITKAVA